MNTDHLADTVTAMIHSLPDKRFTSWITSQRRTSFQFALIDELDSIDAVISYARVYDTMIVVARMGDGWELFTEVPAAGYFYQFRMYPSRETIQALGLPTVPPLDSPQGSRTLFGASIFADKVSIARSTKELSA
jgi:hypothetical protein